MGTGPSGPGIYNAQPRLDFRPVQRLRLGGTLITERGDGPLAPLVSAKSNARPARSQGRKWPQLENNQGGNCHVHNDAHPEVPLLACAGGRPRHAGARRRRGGGANLRLCHHAAGHAELHQLGRDRQSAEGKRRLQRAGAADGGRNDADPGGRARRIRPRHRQYLRSGARQGGQSRSAADRLGLSVEAAPSGCARTAP